METWDEDYGVAEKKETAKNSDASNSSDEAESKAKTDPEPRRSSRSNDGKIRRDENFKYSFTQFTVKEGIRRYGKEAKKAVIAKFIQLFKRKKALIPVKKGSLTVKHPPDYCPVFS